MAMMISGVGWAGRIPPSVLGGGHDPAPSFPGAPAPESSVHPFEKLVHISHHMRISPWLFTLFSTQHRYARLRAVQQRLTGVAVREATGL